VTEEYRQGADCAVANVQVGVADAARLDSNENFPRTRLVHDEWLRRDCGVGLPGYDPLTLDRHTNLPGARAIATRTRANPVVADSALLTVARIPGVSP
jgi:hypothetical protein